ncbi:NEL-type E3 ubiquitin ligase domain-containing protein [Pseudomonas soli]|uniref:NEL-type E3 ubiquitin ligase domain-containing protein n=1 Tax=Pseudomonas soli TaxID=1306993 RepID=UPI0038196BE6
MTTPAVTSKEASRATKLAHATDDFIAEHLPAWLKGTGASAINRLRDSARAHGAIQAHLANAFGKIEPLDAFVQRKLQAEVISPLNLTHAMKNLYWREGRGTLKQSENPLEFPEVDLKHDLEPVQQRLMRNFEANASFFEGTGLALAKGELVFSDTQRIVERCRQADIGQQYQRHLDAFFTPALRDQLARDRRHALAMALDIAVLKQQVAPKDEALLRLLLADKPLTHVDAPTVRVCALTVLGAPVTGGLALEMSGSWQPGAISGRLRRVQAVLVFLPDDPVPFQRFDSWNRVAITLGAALRDDRYRQRFIHRLAIADRAAFISTLNKRLADPQTDAQAAGTTLDTGVFTQLARDLEARVRGDARQLAVPNADVDHAAAKARFQALKAVGQTALNLVGVFVPVVGALLMTQWAAEVLGEVFEGVDDWASGHDHEALEHLLGVAESVAVATVLGVAAHGIAVRSAARGFERSSLVDTMVPVHSDGQAKLSAVRLGDYRLWAGAPLSATRQANGLLGGDGRFWWTDQHVTFEVRETDGQWYLRHPTRESGTHPRLLFNGERGWRLASQRPLEWQGAQHLLGYLWPEALDMTPQRVAQVLKVAGSDESQLRCLLVENRALPVELRDTLERFAAHARIEAFLSRARAGATVAEDDALLQACRELLATGSLDGQAQLEAIEENTAQVRESLLERISKAYLPEDTLQSLIQRDFPGLPDAYALNLLAQASDEQRLVMTQSSRIPLALGEKARLLLQAAQLTRTREALYLPGSYRHEVVELVFALLRRNAGWPESSNLLLRGNAYGGPVLSRLYPSGEATVFVRKAGEFELYTEAGLRLERQPQAPADLCDALVACLPQGWRYAQRWQGPQAAQRMREDLQAWLPSEREALARLMGIREIKPFFNPLSRVREGRIGYPLSGGGGSAPHAERLLRNEIRALYPSFDDEAVQLHLEQLLDLRGSPFTHLLEQRRAYRSLVDTLGSWVAEEQDATLVQTRRNVASQLRRCWRREGEQMLDFNGDPAGMRLALVGLHVGALPALPVGIVFTHVTDLILVGLRLSEMPQGFLQAFSSVRWLNLGNNQLDRIPAEVALMPRLRALRLMRNRIRPEEAGTQVLRGLSRLHTLDLSDNPLRQVSLDFPALMNLREVGLRRTGLNEWPAGLQHCLLLERVDLRDNLIDSLPEFVLASPWAYRQRLALTGNPLPARDFARLVELREPAAVIAAPRPGAQPWEQGLDAGALVRHRMQWTSLQAEVSSNDLFSLLDELTGTRDYQRVPEDLRRRVGSLLDALWQDSALRQDVFELAADPRTCVDSVISCFSALEVRVQVFRMLQGLAPAEGEGARLGLARRLFRLDRVEQQARLHMERLEAQYARDVPEGEGIGVDEVEVSLAYRVGLAQALDLPGQPRTMQFITLAQVGQADLDAAQAMVLAQERSPELALYVSQRDFWLEYLRQTHAEQFEQVEQPFWARQELLYDRRQTLSDGAYLEQSGQLSSERQQAVAALALRLTEQALLVRRLPPL